MAGPEPEKAEKPGFFARRFYANLSTDAEICRNA